MNQLTFFVQFNNERNAVGSQLVEVIISNNNVIRN